MTERKYPVPPAKFACCVEWCAEHRSYPADKMRFWLGAACGKANGFYCPECLVELHPGGSAALELPVLGATLKALGLPDYLVTIQDAGQFLMPDAVYFPCRDEICEEEIVYPASELYWWDGDARNKPGWYCNHCDAGYEANHWRGQFQNKPPLVCLEDVLKAGLVLVEPTPLHERE